MLAFELDRIRAELGLTPTVMVTDTEGRIHYLSANDRSLKRLCLRVVAPPRDGETAAQYIAGLVDVGLIPVDALVLNATHDSRANVCNVVYFESAFESAKAG